MKYLQTKTAQIYKAMDVEHLDKNEQAYRNCVTMA